MRTTIDIDDPVLKEVKRLQKRTGHSLGRLISDLLARSLAEARQPEPDRPPFRWISGAMTAKVDLRDKDAVLDAMDRRHR
jgi:hypothetical protein